MLTQFIIIFVLCAIDSIAINFLIKDFVNK